MLGMKMEWMSTAANIPALVSHSLSMIRSFRPITTSSPYILSSQLPTLLPCCSRNLLIRMLSALGQHTQHPPGSTTLPREIMTDRPPQSYDMMDSPPTCLLQWFRTKQHRASCSFVPELQLRGDQHRLAIRNRQ